MPHSNSRKKRLRQSDARRMVNRSISSSMKTAIKKVMAAVTGGDAQAAKEALPEAMKRIDKAAKKGVIHENNAAKRKSSVSRAINGMESS